MEGEDPGSGSDPHRETEAELLAKEMGDMQSKRGTRSKDTARRTISLDAPQEVVDLELRLMEAMERIERLRSKATIAVGSMLAAQR